MTLIIVGGTGEGLTLPGTPETAANVRRWSPEPGTPANSVAGFAAMLNAFEAEVDGVALDSIVLVDDSDAALAAALVGTKLPVDVAATVAARDAATVNGRLIAQLAGAYTAPA